MPPAAEKERARFGEKTEFEIKMIQKRKESAKKSDTTRRCNQRRKGLSGPFKSVESLTPLPERRSVSSTRSVKFKNLQDLARHRLFSIEGV